MEQAWMGPYLDRMEEMSERFFRFFHARIDEADGLSPPQYHLLSTLERQGELTVSELAQHLGISVPGVAGLLDRLERAGLVRRDRCLEDRRVVRVKLTDLGARRQAEARALRRRVLADFFAPLTPDEVQQLTGLYEKLVSGIPAEAAAWKERR